ncbi:hypothetical protein, partial [Klebsiella aerogenes]|uniref:hypothetical protein n=1 Tax=Klebsiella aerogenes TaxID=548 RepID=UPI001CC60397
MAQIRVFVGQVQVGTRIAHRKGQERSTGRSRQVTMEEVYLMKVIQVEEQVLSREQAKWMYRKMLE